MFRQIFLLLLLFALIAITASWFLSGGPRMVADESEGILAKLIDMPDITDAGAFKLPWQPVGLFPVPDITALDITDPSTTYDNSYQGAQNELYSLELEYDRLANESNRKHLIGNPSPYAGAIHIGDNWGGVSETNPALEHVVIVSSIANSVPIDISGWTIESALSGTRVSIPPAASTFVMGATQAVASVFLDPGASATITTGPSPVGVSFRENMCTGYLNQFQSFAPPLPEECPSPSNVMPLTEDNLRRFGDTCFDALATLATCRYPQSIPGEITATCRAHLQQELSYNGCVAANKFRATFTRPVWRVYLGIQGNIWRDSHDAIRLLDAQGRTVSVFVY